MTLVEAPPRHRTVNLYATKQQIEIINCRARRMGVFGCRRFGKTDTWLNRCIKRTAEKPMEYLFTSPDLGLPTEQFERLCTFVDPLIFKATLDPKPMVTLTNGSRIHLRTFDSPKRLKGLRRIGEIWVDEIQDIPEKMFWRVLQPMLGDVRGTLVVSGQPSGGVQQWYWQKFYLPGQQPDQSYAKSWAFTWRDCIVYQQVVDGVPGIEEIENARKELTKAEFDEMYECKPQASIAAVFNEEDLKACTYGTAQEKPMDGHEYIIGYDLGEHYDPSCAVIIDVDERCVVKVEKIPLHTKHDKQATNLKLMRDRWNKAQVVIDGTGSGGKKTADEMVKFYRDQIPSVKVMIWEPSVKVELVRRAVLAIESGSIAIPRELKVLHDELSIYECKRVGDGWKYSAPEGAHDDSCAAFFMAIWSLKVIDGDRKTKGLPLSTAG